MTSTADIMRDLKQLVDSVEALLQTSTAKEVPNIAKDLGAEAQLNSAIDFFVGLLSKLADALVKLNGSFIQFDAVVAGLEIVAQNIQTLGKGEALNEILIFFEVKTNPFQPVLIGIEKSGQYLETGLGLADNIPTAEDMNQLNLQLKQLISTLVNLKAKPAIPSTTKPTVSLPAPART